jgi:hypothetical protein
VADGNIKATEKWRGVPRVAGMTAQFFLVPSAENFTSIPLLKTDAGGPGLRSVWIF